MARIESKEGEMRRIFRWSRVASVGVVAALALPVVGYGSAAPAAKVVSGSVGPGFTIGLTLDGKKVTKLKAGTPYRFVIKDQSSIHDFHLSGPGLSRVLTSVGYTGTKSYTLTLKKGKYSYVCDPHSSQMHGSFQVA
jgi:plastocyanin